MFELRFDPTRESAGDLLPGLLYRGLKAEYRSSEALPLASVPRQMREQDENLRFRPLHRLIGEDRSVQIGEHVLNLSQSPPYEGWNSFVIRIRALINLAKETELLGTIHRFSIRCVNVLPAAAGQQLGLLDAQFLLSGQPAPEKGFNFRTELETEGFVSIVRILTSGQVALKTGAVRTGLIVDVDTVRFTDAEEFWTSTSDLLEKAHLTIKRTFFSLLKPATLEHLQPQWEEL